MLSITVWDALAQAPIFPPGAPTIVSVEPGDTRVRLSFIAPASDGGSAIIEYTARCTYIRSGGYRDRGFFTISESTTGNTSPIIVETLDNSQNNQCSVRAANAAGYGPPSEVLPARPMPSRNRLFSSSSAAPYGGAANLTASFTGNFQTGTVTFSIVDSGGQFVLPGCNAVKMVASTASCLAPGSYQNQSPRTYLAAYSGDAKNDSANSTLSQVVALNNAVLSVAANPLPPAVSGRTVTLTALVKMNTPIGTVTFFDNGVPIAGCAQIAISVLPDGTDSAVANCTVTAPAADTGVKQYVATYFYPTGHVSNRVFEQVTFDLRLIVA